MFVQPPIPAPPVPTELPTICTASGIAASHLNNMAWTKATLAVDETVQYAKQMVKEMEVESDRQRNFGVTAPDVRWNMTRDYLRVALSTQPLQAPMFGHSVPSSPLSSVSSPFSVSSPVAMEETLIGSRSSYSSPGRRPPQLAPAHFEPPPPEVVPREFMTVDQVNEWAADSRKKYYDELAASSAALSPRNSPMNLSVTYVNTPDGSLLSSTFRPSKDQDDDLASNVLSRSAAQTSLHQ